MPQHAVLVEASRYYLDKGSHRRLYRFRPDDYSEMKGSWCNGEMALPGDPPGELEVMEAILKGARSPT